MTGQNGGPRWDEAAQRWVGPGTEPVTPVRRAVRPPDPNRGAALVAALAVVVIGGIGVGVWQLVSDGDDGKGGGKAGGASTSESVDQQSPQASLSDTWPGGSTDSAGVNGTGGTDIPTAPTASPSAQTPPVGYKETRDPEGFGAYVPDGWEREKRSNGVFYTSPDESALIQVFALPPSANTPTPLEALAETERSLSKERDSYQRYRLERVGSTVGGTALGSADPGGGTLPAGADAELEYGYVSDTAGPRRVIDRAFTAEDGNQYAILVMGPASAWPEQVDQLRTTFESFCPEGHCVTG
ncbi:hypothetical protein [Streptomyces zagrosensis]|uniref:Serine/arginine repetitive matrix protein 2 n=1 Tax=Streptomyces zagrosensis TaxID=1042984 RepID=A0A7W9Q6Z8_9ACTN|nr:hypothetical protein [Streptomyces zagrosensis]MBB5934774.1 hypothetical protein [Streptomyces zagrosensis]